MLAKKYHDAYKKYIKKWMERHFKHECKESYFLCKGKCESKLMFSGTPKGLRCPLHHSTRLNLTKEERKELLALFLFPTHRLVINKDMARVCIFNCT